MGGSSLGGVTGPENEEKITELADQLRVQCLSETTTIPQRSMQGLASYDISVASNCVIPTKGKGVVQSRLAISLPLGVYTKIVQHSGLSHKIY